MIKVKANDIYRPTTKGKISNANKANAWKSADWKWCLKNFKPEHTEIRVIVWGTHDKPSNSELAKDFAGTEAKQAEAYAREQVEKGCPLACVQKRVYFSYSEREHYHLIEDQSFEPEES